MAVRNSTAFVISVLLGIKPLAFVLLPEKKNVTNQPIQ